MTKILNLFFMLYSVHQILRSLHQSVIYRVPVVKALERLVLCNLLILNIEFFKRIFFLTVMPENGGILRRHQSNTEVHLMLLKSK